LNLRYYLEEDGLLIQETEESIQMSDIREMVLIVAILNFAIGLGFSLYGMSIFASSGFLNTFFMIFFLWVVLSAFCNVCVVFWVATDKDSIEAESSGAQNTEMRLSELAKEVREKFALLERLKKLEPQQKMEEQTKKEEDER
jgi:hypothetical protein